MSIHSTTFGMFELRENRLFNEAVSPDTWWRAEDVRYANYDPWAEFEQPSGSHLVIKLTPYKLERVTARGCFVSLYGEKFYVRGNANKQRAVPTKELAIRDLIARKKLHAVMCEKRLARARQHLAAAERALKEV